MYNYFLYRVRNVADAEDLTAATFEKAWRARDTYRADLAGLPTWLLSIARNVAIDHLRAARFHVALDEAEQVTDGTTPETELTARSDRARLRALVENLPERERELVALKYGAGLTNREIASITGLTESNVGTILHRCVQVLRGKWDHGSTTKDGRVSIWAAPNAAAGVLSES